MEMMKSVFATSLAVFALAACGGASDITSTEQAMAAEGNATIESSAPACPVGYKVITIDSSSVAGASFSLVAGDATFSFKTSAQNAPSTSIRVCFGVSSNVIVDGGMYMMSDTYEIKAYPLATFNSQFRNLLDRTLTVNFSLAGLPAGTNFGDLPNKVKVFNDAEGALTETVQTVSSFSNLESSGTLVVHPAGEGRYVVAFKP